MQRRGFTIVELIITITIMGILLTLAVVNLNSTQANARDNERRGDVEAIALNLENYYSSVSNAAYSGGTYVGGEGIGPTSTQYALPDLDPKSTLAPNAQSSATTSLVTATNAETDPSRIMPQPSKANDIYVYQPLRADGSLCGSPDIDGDCRRFNIYYFQESDGQIHVISSKRQ